MNSNNTEMEQKMDLKQEVVKASTVMNVVKLEKSCRSPAAFRFLIHLHGISQPDVNLANYYRASSPTASVIHPFREGDDQKKHLANTQECSSPEPEEQMNDKHRKTDNDRSESPFHLKEQSLSRRSIRLLLILFIILGMFVFFMIAWQHVYLQVKRSWDFDKCMNGLVKLRFVGMHNPPV